MSIAMCAEFRILVLENGEYSPLEKEQVKDLCPGAFLFSIGGKDVPFDFDAFSCSFIEEGVFRYYSGYGCLFNDFELSDCYDEDLEALELSRDDLTPVFLASVSEIKEFHVNFIDENEREIDCGWYEDNLSEEEKIKIKIVKISFSDNTGKEYPVLDSVLQKFNGDIPE